MNNSTYSALAPHYDELMCDVDYDRWADFICSTLAKYNIEKGSLVLDAGCGTGQMTVRLAKNGFDMIGVDLSPEMLTLAKAYADRCGVNPLYICQDMSAFELYGSVKAAISCLDSVNYLTKNGQLESFFASMQNYIEKDGLLIFDVNTKKKFEQVYSDNSYILEGDGVLCAWQNYYNKSTHMCTFYLSVFEENEDGRYTRTDEIQKERYFPAKTLRNLLEKHGFEILHVISDFDMTKADEDDLRHYYICRKK